MDTRFVCCDGCGGDGRRISGNYDERDYGRCIACDGKGEIEIELQPITMEDLDAEA